MRAWSLLLITAGCAPEPFIDPTKYPPTDLPDTDEVTEEPSDEPSDTTDVTDDGVDADSDLDDTATWAPVVTDTAVQLLLIGNWGLAEIEPGVSWRGTETFAFAAYTSDNLWIDELFDLCRWERQANDWTSSGLSGNDPWAATLSSCPDCQFAFSVALTDARETSVHGDCGSLGVTRPPDEAFAYGFDNEAYIAGYGNYPVLQYFSTTNRTWQVASTIAVWDEPSKTFLYVWLNAIYGY